MATTSTDSRPTRATPYFLYLLLNTTLGPLLFGYHLAELNAPQSVLTCVQHTPNPPRTTFLHLPPCIPMTLAQFSLATSIFTLGGLCAALAAGPLATALGRLRPMLLTSILSTCGASLSTLAPSLLLFALGRFLSGLAAGAATVIVPLYISEISPAETRGFWGAATQVMINVGIFGAQLLGYFWSREDGAWRGILGVGAVVAVVQGVGLGFGGLESPVWLAERGRRREAEDAWRKIRGGGVVEDEVVVSGNHTAPDVEPHSDEGAEAAPLLSSTTDDDENRRPTMGFLTVILHPSTRPSVRAVLTVMLAQQFTGINSIIMYSVHLLSRLLPTSAALLAVSVASLNILVTALGAPLADTWGRKKTLLVSITGMGFSSLLLGTSIRASIPPLSVISTAAFVASFAIGLGPIPFILASELSPPQAVGAVQSWALTANWSATFGVAQFFPLVDSWVGEGNVYFLFAAVAAGFLLAVGGWVPETKGKGGWEEVWGLKKEVRAD
ncbi:hypothetical protein M433DRAFT_72639 [Acidomyces richmondensis BFW]|nr:MAG: hypothetical protein FE78DRAFT_156062 [Acidomyces sp. 'richmondensis']KYG42992.1 hypothetical protein M433DRAFT_72639 [Acidomyces richmondensis BFW]